MEYEKLKNRLLSDTDQSILTPMSSICTYRFWDECYLRWSAPAQTLHGGRIQADLGVTAALADVSHQLNELRYLRDQLEMERTKFGQQLRHYRVQPINLTPNAMERMTSAFPFNWQTMAIPEDLCILPLRYEKQQQLGAGGLSTPRSALELATFSLSPQAASSSCERFSMWDGASGTNSNRQELVERMDRLVVDKDGRLGNIGRITRNRSVYDKKTNEIEPIESKKMAASKNNNTVTTFDQQQIRSNRKYSTDTIV